jgi:hypothetical protein
MITLNGQIVDRDNAIRIINRIQDEKTKGFFTLIKDLTTRLQQVVKNDKLSGQVLKVRSGRLKNSIQKRYIFENENVMHGEVFFTNKYVPYGAKHEYGANGNVQVKRHSRMQTQAFGKPINPKFVMVQAHQMKLNFPERSFMRTALQDMDPEIQQGLVKLMSL